MTARRRRRPLVREALVFWAAIAVVLLAVTAWHLFGWVLATAAISGGTWLLGRRSTGRQVSSNSAPVAVSRGRQMPQIGTARTRANGWTPPTRSVLLSDFCTRDEHIWCHDGRCQCSCGHPSQRPARTAPTPEDPPF
jgi:hypothetical protein